MDHSNCIRTMPFEPAPPERSTPADMNTGAPDVKFSLWLSPSPSRGSVQSTLLVKGIGHPPSATLPATSAPIKAAAWVFPAKDGSALLVMRYWFPGPVVLVTAVTITVTGVFSFVATS